MILELGIKVFLVNDTDDEGHAYYAASTYKKAWQWIKDRQIDDVRIHRERGWTPKQLEVMLEYFRDENQLHPYYIQEMEIDEKY